MPFARLARRGWFLAVELGLLAVGILAALLSLSAARSSLSTALRVPHPDRTFFAGRGHGSIPDASYSDVTSWEERGGVFSRVGAFSVWGPVNVATESRNVSVDAAWVAHGMTSFLPQRMAAGRPLVDSDFYRGSKNVLVSELLVDRLGLHRALGSVIQTTWGDFRIIGVLPGWARFPYPNQPDIIIPTVPNSQDSSTYTVLGELRPGLGREQAERALNLASQEGGAPANGPARLISLKASLDPGAIRISEYGLVLGLLTLSLLVATAALVELLDAIRGKRERSIRSALGATRARLVFERLFEVFVICILATAAGGLLVVACRSWLAQAWTTDWVTTPRLDGFSLAALGALLLFVCIAVSIAPVLLARGTHAYAALKEERATTTRTVQRTRMAIVALQVAVSIAFGFGAANLAGRLHALAAEPLGINTANIWIAAFDLPLMALMETQWHGERQARQDAAIQQRLRLRLGSLPGVAEVAFASEGPAAASHGIQSTPIAPAGQIPSAGNTAVGVPVTSVDPYYLQLLGCRLLAGRYFTVADAWQSPLSGGPVILSEPLARELFGKVNPVGKEIAYVLGGTPSGKVSRVVGLVSGMRTFGLRVPLAPELFTPLAGTPGLLAIRVKGTGIVPFAEVQRAVSDAIPGMRIEDFGPLRARFDTELAVPRQRLRLLAFFAAISAAVAAFGLASMLLVVIKERDLEIGVRRALGASDRDLAKALLKQVLPWVALGFVPGIAFPILFPAPLGVRAAAGAADAVWAGVFAVAAMLLLIAVSLWLPLRRAFRRPINDLLRVE